MPPRTPSKTQEGAAISTPRSAGNAKVKEFSLIEKFPFGYRAREDITTLPPNVLIRGSQNVLTLTTQNIGIRQGYTLDGQRDTAIAGTESAYDWARHTGDVRHLRSGANSTGTNGKLQFRYVASAGDIWSGHTFTEDQVYWIDLMTGLTYSAFNYCDFWDFSNELISMMLFVNTTSNIFMWTGGVTTAASYTVNTITKNGTDTWAQGGFLTGATYTRELLINGNTYSYTGGAGTTTLTGVAPDPSAEPVNSVVIQKPVTTANSAITGIPAAFKNFIIQNMNNQIYLSATDDQSVYVSKINNFKNFSFASPRLVGEGAILTLDGVPTAMVPEQNEMYISAGKDYWFQTSFQLSSTNAAEALQIQRLKTTAQQAAQSQALTTKIKNNIVNVSFEKIINSLGTQENFLNDPQVQDLSFSIVQDVDNYDFTGGSVKFWRKLIFVSVPNSGLIRIYNMTNDQNQYWEAPQIMPFNFFSIIDGDIYGHSSAVTNTFKMFSGWSDDGAPSETIAAFAFNNNGVRNILKDSNSCYTEGYMSTNTILTQTLQRDFDGFATTISFDIRGDDTRILPQPVDTSSLGKVSLGKKSLGGQLNPANGVATSNLLISGMPQSKFHVFKTYQRKPYFEEQIRYSSDGVGQCWQLIAFGTNASSATEQPTFVTE